MKKNLRNLALGTLMLTSAVGCDKKAEETKAEVAPVEETVIKAAPEVETVIKAAPVLEEAKVVEAAIEEKSSVAKKCEILPEVFGSVADVKILRADFVEVLEKNIPESELARFLTIPDDQLKLQAQMYTNGKIDNEISIMLAKKAGFEAKPEDFVKDFDSWYEKMQEEQKAKFTEYLGNEKTTLEEYRKKASEDKDQLDRLTISKWIKATFDEAVEVSEEDIQKKYEADKEKYTSAGQVKASYLVIKPADETPEADTAAEAKVKEALAKLQTGADFLEITKEYTTCPATEGIPGDLGYFSKGEFNPLFEEKAFALNVGEFSDYFKTQDGYQIVKIMDKKEANVIPLDKVKADISKALEDEKKAAKVQTIMANGREEFGAKLNF